MLLAINALVRFFEELLGRSGGCGADDPAHRHRHHS